MLIQCTVKKPSSRFLIVYVGKNKAHNKSSLCYVRTKLRKPQTWFFLWQKPVHEGSYVYQNHEYTHKGKENGRKKTPHNI